MTCSLVENPLPYLFHGWRVLALGVVACAEKKDSVTDLNNLQSDAIEK